ncbi:hypothetical protein [Streptococcus acidominimus]|uniref:DUF1149 family protein n=1 Tax=Streptococcus acidominimus TaxID=1326 RepID=A0A1Q8EFT1_STRAI|nr:hypothetical protein [Streptococcus acidominimus]OLF50671.1 hypothetical protein BU200_01235 [Streptococcus acidominimus]SUN04999.1 Uncharacterised protein [Streptococcus acidominimus]SUN41209.1 Uncharacterised protein [Streptococcus acidominimus]
MKSTNIEIRRIAFSKFEFNIGNTRGEENEGRASVNVGLPDREEGQENQLLLMKMIISYPDNQYQVDAEIDAVYSVLISDLPEDISQDGEFQQALVEPMIEKLRLYVGLFSEGAYGAVQIPNMNFNQD